ncbi:Fc.00g074050.m01.CDS01 [Cosmosporella sp. VM-42]
MAAEDERYRQSSQYRLWSYSPTKLRELRAKTNELAKQQITPRLAADPAPDFLTPDEETRLVKFFTVELIRAAQFCELPTEIRATAATFLRRFYLTNSVMTYPPTELLKTCLFFGCKAEGFFYKLHKFAENFPNTTGEQILAGEFLLCQGIRFAFDVRHPFRALEGAILELRRLRPDEGTRINRAHALARDTLKFSPLVTDVYFHYAPSQIMMAALSIVDAGLVDDLIPVPPSNGQNAHGAHADLRAKIMATIASCRKMLEEEPPERMADYWGTPEIVKSMKPLRKKLQKCRDPDRANLVNLQRARRELTLKKEKKPSMPDDTGVFGDGDARESKRMKLDKADDVFGPPL